MARWNLLPFLRLQNRTDVAASSSSNHHHNNNKSSNTTTNAPPPFDHLEDLYVPQQSFDRSMWGCEDELGIVACQRLPELFADHHNHQGGATCRWPLAEVCLSTCGQCPLVEAAQRCQSLPEEMDPRMQHDEYMDWEAFFEGIVTANTNTNTNNTSTTSTGTATPTFTAVEAPLPSYLQGARILNRESPWVAEFPNYLTEDEADELIRIAQLEGYRIEDEHPRHIRDVNVTNCDSIQCLRQPIVTELYRRVSELMGFHPNNFESMEFIDYSVGQHYSWHSDEYGWKDPIQDPLAVLAGPRLLTMFYYLSDVEEGGETAFAGPDASGRTKRLAVTPKKGKVILWANMKPEWRFSDSAAVHSAMPVKKGRKVAGTLWIHASGFRIPELYAGQECHPRTFYEE